MAKRMELEKEWDLIENGMTELNNMLEGEGENGIETQQFSVKFTELYTSIYNILCCKVRVPEHWWEYLYERFREYFDKYIKSKVALAMMLRREWDMDDHDCELLLRGVSKQWRNYKIMNKWLSNLFSYIDRHISISSLKAQELKEWKQPRIPDVGPMCFREAVYREIRNNGRIRDVVIDLIDRERDGQEIDRNIVKNILDMFMEVGPQQDYSYTYYDRDFEPVMLERTGSYYSRKAMSWVTSGCSCPEYMFNAEECLKSEENERVYLNSDVHGKVLRKAEEELICGQKAQLLRDFPALLSNNMGHDISRMYRLFSRTPDDLRHLANTFRDHIITQGKSMLQEMQGCGLHFHREEQEMAAAEVFVTRSYEIYDKYLQYVNQYFVKNSLLANAFRDAFQEILNTVRKSAELLAVFCHGLLRNLGDISIDDDIIETKLEMVERILGLVDDKDKDVFAESCTKRLATSLLFDRKDSYDAERTVLTRLKRRVGWQLTRKMEGLLHDLTAEEGIQMQSWFKKYCEKKEKDNDVSQLRMEFTVTVLNAVFWLPTYGSCAELRLPDEMATCVKLYSEFYRTQHELRRLSWQHSLGSCHVMGIFEEKAIELVVTPHQACVLLLFNTWERLSFSQVKSHLNLCDEEISRLLQSLASSTCAILVKDPNGVGTVAQTDVFEFNPKFTHPGKRIRVLSAPASDQKEKS